MSETQIESLAFRQAHLKSERVRLLIVLGTIGIGFLLRSVRVLMHSGGENVQLWLTTLGVLAPFAAYEFSDVARSESCASAKPGTPKRSMDRQYLRYPQRSGHLLLLLRHWLCNISYECHHVFSVHLVVQRIEAKVRRFLRFGVQRRLQLLNT